MKQLIFSALLLCSLSSFAQTDTAGKKQTIYQYVEQMPQPPYDVYRFVSDRMRYPDAAVKNKIQGIIYVRFVVKADGVIEEVSVLRSLRFEHDSLSGVENKIPVSKLGYGMEEEAIRVIKLMTPWKPGKQNGVPVAVSYALPVDFKIKQK